jgi:hypothetical protein
MPRSFEECGRSGAAAEVKRPTAAGGNEPVAAGAEAEAAAALVVLRQEHSAEAKLLKPRTHQVRAVATDGFAMDKLRQAQQHTS